ncbi:methyltransferase domain-containing protein [Sphingobacterium sp. SGG-5]|uniref:methyltransferase domain-containing protein n=1 Tax=Sphingobacterium sp. SGG-5 TaxID=2710881 RepID=UPI0013ECA8C2|nr:methyltransferase domain-containing protein [Sphingobacterium sp. SGG-5]NGM61990.1 methyltransferase domain-containing protein [Sphingobacterium sp. SGG-5]
MILVYFNENMAEKHYNIDYLTETVKILGGVKERSYEYFRSVPDGGTIVDLGCGTGQDVLNMARIFEGSHFNLIGIDHDPNMIKKGHELADTDTGITFLLADVATIPLSDTSANGIRMERLVQHVPNPLGLFTEVYRVLHGDGVVVVVESDWKSLSFYNGDLAVSDKINDYLSAQKVNNGRAAQSLSTYLNTTGFRNIAIAVQPFVLTRYQDACTYLWIDKMIDEMLTLHLIDEKEHKDFIEAQKHADETGYFSCSMNIVTVSAIK